MRLGPLGAYILCSFFASIVFGALMLCGLWAWHLAIGAP